MTTYEQELACVTEAAAHRLCARRRARAVEKVLYAYLRSAAKSDKLFVRLWLPVVGGMHSDGASQPNCCFEQLFR
jgi:hypothetical protein